MHQQHRFWTHRARTGHVDLPRLMEAGVGLQVFALFSDPAHRDVGYTIRTLEMIEDFYHGLDTFGGDSRVAPQVVLTRHDVNKARRGIGILLSIEGGEALGGSLRVLHSFFRLGVRAMGLVWNHRNELADGVEAGASASGLTPFGKQVVASMEDLGMVVDVSHLSEASFWDLVRTARRPFIASHSNARALCDHPRNLTDAQIRAIADYGGVIGINFHSPFLRQRGRADIDDVVAHIDHIASLVGIDHVGLGSDYDGIPETPIGLDDVTYLPRLADELLLRGYRRSEVEAVMGENFARLFEQLLPS